MSFFRKSHTGAINPFAQQQAALTLPYAQNVCDNCFPPSNTPFAVHYTVPGFARPGADHDYRCNGVFPSMVPITNDEAPAVVDDVYEVHETQVEENENVCAHNG